MVIEKILKNYFFTRSPQIKLLETIVREQIKAIIMKNQLSIFVLDDCA